MFSEFVPSQLPDPNCPLAIPAFLERRVFVTINLIDGDTQTFRVRTPKELHNPNAPRIWAPMRSISEIRRKETSPAANLYCANRTWPVQIVTKGKFPQNLHLHDDWESFLKNHDFEDFPVDRTFSGSEVTYIVVKDESVKNSLVQGAMQGVPLNTRPDLMEQNGIKRPKSGSITAAAWASYDQMKVDNTDFKVVFDRLKESGMNPSTIRTQYSHWKKFNGISK